jgi:uncharacterized membrane protein YgcG
MDARHLKWIILLAAGTVSCGASGPDEPWSNASSPIIGGQLAGVCEWPTAVLIPSAGCSGTLVHPRVVIIAKHCLGSTPASVTFGESRAKTAKTVRVSKCYRHPQTDFGFCTLAEDVIGMPIIPVMAACEMTELKVGAPIVEAGFGDTSAGNDSIFGTKKWIAGTIVRAGATRTTLDVTTGTQDGEYFGDSGGPVFIKMPDETWRLIGNDLTSPDWNTSNRPRVSTYTSMPYHVAWAEQQSGIDITPCHDASGWNPTAACVGSPINPGEGVGTWANACSGQTMLLQPTCDGSDGGTRIDASRPPADAGGDARRDAASADGASGGDARADTGGPAIDAAGGSNSGSDAPGASGAGGSGGAPGSGGNAGAYGSSGSGGASSAGRDAGADPQHGLANANADAGCSCETAPARGYTSTSLVAMLASLVAFAWRKRRHGMRALAQLSLSRASPRAPSS